MVLVKIDILLEREVVLPKVNANVKVLFCQALLPEKQQSSKKRSAKECNCVIFLPVYLRVGAKS